MFRGRTIAKLFLVFFVFCSASVADEFRTWTSSAGRASIFKMAVVRQTATNVTLKRQDNGRELVIAKSQLSEEDQRYLQSLNVASPARNASSVSKVRFENRSNSITGVRWQAPVLDDENIQEWTDFLQPTDEELVWRTKIRWHNNLASAAEEARRLQRPILLWTMNGNSCGET